MKLFTKQKFLLLISFVLFLGEASAAWPERPLKIIVPAAAGESPDVLTRMFSNELAKRLGQPIVVENRPGAAGSIGMQALMNAVPDGYTIGYGNNGTLATNEFLYSKLPYAPEKLVPIVALAKTSSLLVVNNNSPIHNVKEFITYARQNPSEIQYGSAGNGTSSHLGAELFKTMAGVTAQHIPYKGGGQATIDLIGGNLTFVFDNISTIAPMIANGKVRALAVTSKERLPIFPDIPTLNEEGVQGFEMTAWGALLAPPGTPQDVIVRLNNAINDIMKDESMRRQLGVLSLTPIGGSADYLREFIIAERVKWGDVVRKSGAKAD